MGYAILVDACEVGRFVAFFESCHVANIQHQILNACELTNVEADDRKKACGTALPSPIFTT